MTAKAERKQEIYAPQDAIATLFIFLGVAFLPALIGTAEPPDLWYESLTKSSWDAPRWVFGPVWIVLYTLIGYAGYLAWSSSHGHVRHSAAAIYALQLVLNALWSPVFFGYHSPDLALLIITAQWFAILLNVVAFYRIKPAAGLLLAPYLIWVTFAWLLNGALWASNR